MKKIYLIAVMAAVASAPATAATEFDNGNSLLATITGAATGYLMRPLSVELTQPLILPDLVIPAPSNGNNTVSLASLGTLQTLTYSANGNPGVSGTNAKTNANGNTNSAVQLGKLKVIGHQGKAISVSVAASDGSATLGTEGYQFDVDLFDTAKLAQNQDLSAGSEATGGTFEYTYGGMLTAASNASPGAVSLSVDVTVSYR